MLYYLTFRHQEGEDYAADHIYSSSLGLTPSLRLDPPNLPQAKRSLETLFIWKGVCHEIFDLQFFPDSNPSWPLIKRLKYFRIRFGRDTLSLSKHHTQKLFLRYLKAYFKSTFFSKYFSFASLGREHTENFSPSGIRPYRTAEISVGHTILYCARRLKLSIAIGWLKMK